MGQNLGQSRHRVSKVSLNFVLAASKHCLNLEMRYLRIDQIERTKEVHTFNWHSIVLAFHEGPI